MVTLGINMHHDASMCIVEDGKLLSFINTERITRIKKDRELNQEVLDYVLEASNKSFDDIDNIACAYLDLMILSKCIILRSMMVFYIKII